MSPATYIEQNLRYHCIFSMEDWQCDRKGQKGFFSLLPETCDCFEPFRLLIYKIDIVRLLEYFISPSINQSFRNTNIFFLLQLRKFQRFSTSFTYSHIDTTLTPSHNHANTLTLPN